MLDIVPAHQAEHTGRQRFGVAVVHTLAQDRHFAEDRSGLDDGCGQRLAISRQTVYSHTPCLKDEEHLACILWRVEGCTSFYRLHRRTMAEHLDLIRRQILEDVDVAEVSLLIQLVLACCHGVTPPLGPAVPARW